MKIFISFKFENENKQDLEIFLGDIRSILEQMNHKIYCSFWDAEMFEEKKFTSREIIEYAFKEIDKSDVFLALVKSSDISEGMLVEAGYAIAKGKKIILLISKDVNDHKLRRVFDNRILVEFDNLEDLKNKLAELKI